MDIKIKTHACKDLRNNNLPPYVWTPRVENPKKCARCQQPIKHEITTEK